MAATRPFREEEARDLAQAAAAIAGFELGKYEYGAAANLSGIRTKRHTFSVRRDSRTVFALDQQYGHDRKLGCWTGNKKVVLAAGRRAMRAADVPRTEIASVEVLSEMGQVAERLSDNRVRVLPPRRLRRIAQARRAIAGVPVWSSYATVGLNGAGDIGSVEVHWPEIPSVVVKEARVLQELVKQGIKPPEMQGARAEDLAAGILHSPAIGFFMDVVAAIRVVYRGDDPTVGRKPTLYLDRNGEQVALPRDVPAAEIKPQDRPGPKSRRKASPSK